MPKIREVRKPEGGAERELVWSVHHDCPTARALVKETGDDDCDLLVFPIGLFGFDIPNGIPFGVPAIEPCGACGRQLSGMWMWIGSKIVTLNG